MVDLEKTQAEWNGLHGILGSEFRIQNTIESWHDRAAKLRSKVLQEFDENGVYTDIDLAGEAVIDQNTDSKGFLHVTFTGGASPSTQVYKDSAKGGGDLVASGATASATTTTLDEKNSSGFADLSVTLGSSGGAFAADADIRWQVTQDFKRDLEDVYLNVLDVDQDRSETKSKDDVEVTIAAPLRTMFARRRTTLLENTLQGHVSTFVKATEADRRRNAGFIYEYDTATVIGQVLITGRLGIYPEVRQSMLDQSAPAGVQTVQQGNPTSGNLKALAGNTGKLRGEGLPAASGTVATLVLDQHLQSGTLRLRCTQQVVGLTRFTVENVLAQKLLQIPDGGRQRSRASILANNAAFVEFRYLDGPIGVDFTLRYEDPVETGDDGDIFSGTTITGANDGETDLGNVFMSVQKTSAIASGDTSDIFTVRAFSEESRITQVGVTTVDTFSGVTSGVSITTGELMVIMFNFKNDNADTKLPLKASIENDVKFDLQVPRIGDQFEIPLTEDFQSEHNKYLARNHVGSFPASASPTISDDLAKFFPTLEAR